MSKAAKITGPLGKIKGEVKTTSGKKSDVREIEPDNTTLVTSEVNRGTDKKPIMEAVTKAMKDAINNFIHYAAAEKSAKEQKEENVAVIRGYVGVVRTQNAVAGDYQKTYRVLGSKTAVGIQNAADVSEVDKFSVVDEKDVDALKTLVGEDFFKDNFELDDIIQIRKDVMDNKEKRKELSKILAKSFGGKLSDWFVKKEVWSAKDGLCERQYSKLDEKKRDKLDDLCSQSNDSVKDTSYKPE